MISNLGKVITTGWQAGDFNYDGFVDGTDFTLLVGNFGKQSNGTTIVLPASDWIALDAYAAANNISLIAVPEPTAAARSSLSSASNSSPAAAPILPPVLPCWQPKSPSERALAGISLFHAVFFSKSRSDGHDVNHLDILSAYPFQCPTAKIRLFPGTAIVYTPYAGIEGSINVRRKAYKSVHRASGQ